MALIDAAASITRRIVSSMCVRPVCPCPARAAECSATDATSFIVPTSFLEVAAISREVAPICVVVVAISVAVACCSRAVAAISVTDALTWSPDSCTCPTRPASSSVIRLKPDARLPNSSSRSSFSRPDRSPVRIASSTVTRRLRGRAIARRRKNPQTKATRRPNPTVTSTTIRATAADVPIWRLKSTTSVRLYSTMASAAVCALAKSRYSSVLIRLTLSSRVNFPVIPSFSTSSWVRR